MLKVTLTGIASEIEIVKRQMEKDYLIIKYESHPETNSVYLELDFPKINHIERGGYEVEIPAEQKEAFQDFIEELNREEIRFQLEEEDRRLLLSFQLLDKKRVAELYKSFCIKCGIDHDILQKCSIFVEGHMKDPFEKALDEKGIESTFTPKGTGYMLELQKIDIPMFERIRREFGARIRLQPPERPHGRHMSSHRHRGSRSR